MEFPAIDMDSQFYKYCKARREQEDELCQECPFRKGIELTEACALVIQGVKAQAQREASQLDEFRRLHPNPYSDELLTV